MKQLLVLLLSAFMVFGMASCGDDDGVNGANCDNAFTAYSNSVAAFASADPMNAAAYEAACEGLKTALLNLIDDCNLDNIIGNLGISQQEWNDLINDIQNEDCTP